MFWEMSLGLTLGLCWGVCGDVFGYAFGHAFGKALFARIPLGMVFLVTSLGCLRECFSGFCIRVRGLYHFLCLFLVHYL